MPDNADIGVQGYRAQGDGHTWIGIGGAHDGEIVTIEQLTSGAAWQSGRQIMTTEPRGIIWNLPADYDSFLFYHPPDESLRPQGAISVINYKADATFNRAVSKNGYSGISFSFDYIDRQGVLHTFEAPFAQLTAIGSKLWYMEGEDGYLHYEKSLVGPHAAMEEQALRERGYQLATTEIAIQRTMASYMLRYHFSELTDIMQRGIVGQGGDELTTESAVAYELARINLDNAAMFTRGYFDFSRQE